MSRGGGGFHQDESCGYMLHVHVQSSRQSACLGRGELFFLSR